MTALSPRRTFSGTALKTIACITMLVDHIGASCIEVTILCGYRSIPNNPMILSRDSGVKSIKYTS